MVGRLDLSTEFGVDRADDPSIGASTERIAAESGWRRPYDLMPGRPLPAPHG